MRLSLRRAFAALSAALIMSAAPGEARAVTGRYALSVLHFNIQYVAGGLRGFLAAADPSIDLSADEVEDRIVRESFEPVLDMFLAHPDWGTDIELQGYMLDVMAARHPDVLDKLRKLASSGQVDVDSFHYSDQLYLAYPREDWARSEALDAKAFASAQIPRGKTVFCQEGQAGPGLASVMKGAGYDTLIFPKNLFAYQHGDATEPKPLYTWGDAKMITSRGIAYNDGANTLDVVWWFVDDGELLATGDVDPYLAEIFKKDPAAIAKYEAQLTDLAAQGYQITTVSQYVAAIEGDIPAVDPPPLLDGTWQPKSTDGIHRWLGGSGLWWKDERDNDVRSLGAMAHRELLAAETIAAKAGLDAQGEIESAFRLLSLGQVSDATGINPFRGEVEYGIAHFTEALRIARDVIRRSKEKLGASQAMIDTASGVVEVGASAPAAPQEVSSDIPVVVNSGVRASKVSFRRHDEGHTEVVVQFGAGDALELSVMFPGEMGDIVYTPGLADAPVHVPRGGFVFDHFDLALSDGLIGLGGDRFVIKDQATVHVSATVTPGSGDVLFRDEAAPA